MSIQAILYRKGSLVVTVAPGASIRSAAEKLRDRNIAALVVKSGDAVLGLISEREIVHALARHGEPTCGLTVGDVMARDVVTVAPGDSLKRAMSLMTRHRKRHLLVLRDGEPAGIVSIGDVIKHRLEDLELNTTIRSDLYATAHGERFSTENSNGRLFPSGAGGLGQCSDLRRGWAGQLRGSPQRSRGL